ncbi:MAG: PEGA domain-containing protein [Deltaproteobacteria bacterium]|nr:MAG: PEGA domain-containing protein [Deltaproteobacteria bacterium]
MSLSGTGGPGRKLGRYHLVEPIGGGPTGEVFRAKVYGVAGFERQFAVKLFHAELAARRDASDALARAARRYSGYEHPRIARLQEFGVAGGRTFAAVEFVAGVDLMRLGQATHGAGHPLPAGAALAIALRAARAVAYVHGRGGTHLGVCPTNILCVPDGEVKVTDFGLLPPRLPERPADDLTLAARLPYLAPEQIVGEPTGPATDVFQLGAVLYELLAGRPAFRGPSALEIGQAVLSGRFPEPDAPPVVLEIVYRALARLPGERYADAGALADAIEAAARAAAVAGDARDAGRVVREVIGRIDAAAQEQASGLFAVPLPAPPPAAPVSPLRRALDRGATPPPVPVDDRAATVPAPRPTVLGVAAPAGAGGGALSAGLRGRADVDEDAPTKIRGDRAQDGVSDVTPLPAPVPGTLDLAPDRAASPPLRARDPDVVDLESYEVEFVSEAAGTATGGETATRGGAAISEATGSAEVAAHDAAGGGEAAGGGQAAAPARPVRLRRVALVWIAAALAGGAGFFVYAEFVGFDGGRAREPLARDRGAGATAAAGAHLPAAAGPGAPGVPTPSAAASAPGRVADGGARAAAGRDARDAAAGAPPGDAGAPARSDGAVAVAAAPPTGDLDAGAAVAGALDIRSTPAGATIYLDGAKVGRTPKRIDDATGDQHRLALILPGYDLYVTDVAGDARVDLTLREVTPFEGRAGIKVRCRKKNRYYVYVDGAPTGQLCPTERIGVSLGEHEVEIYDPVTDTRSKFKANVEQTRLSLRVRVD